MLEADELRLIATAVNYEPDKKTLRRIANRLEWKPTKDLLIQTGWLLLRKQSKHADGWLHAVMYIKNDATEKDIRPITLSWEEGRYLEVPND